MCIAGGESDIADEGGGSAHLDAVGQPEIDELHPVTVDLRHHILGFEGAVEVARGVQVLEGFHHLLADQRHCLDAELLLPLDEEFLQVLVQLFHNDERVLCQSAESIDPGEVVGGDELNEEVELFLHKDGLLDGVGGTLPWFFSILQA